MFLLLMVIVISIINAYSPKKAIFRKKNRWHAKARLNQIVEFSDGDEPSRFGLDAMFWFARKGWLTLTYNKWVVKDENLNKFGVNGKEIHYQPYQEIAGLKKAIVTVTEEVTRLRKVEIHPYLVQVTLVRSGYTFFLAFTAKIRVERPMDALKVDNFLVFFGNELNDAVYPWAVSKEELWEHEHIEKPEKGKKDFKDVVLEKMIGLKIDDKNSIELENITIRDRDGKITKTHAKISLIDYMNEKINVYGLHLNEFSLDVGYDANVKNILDKRNAQKVAIEDAKLAQDQQAAKIKRAQTSAKERNEGFKQEKKEWILDKEKVEVMALAEAKVNSAWKVGTLMIGEQKEKSLLSAMTARLFSEKPTKEVVEVAVEEELKIKTKKK